jgi:N-dimethylarginine dimethylaminohydrolase
MTSLRTTPRILMCRPEHFTVSYTINPWMDPKSWARADRTLSRTAMKEWQRFHDTIKEQGAEVELVPPVAGLPDLVFTANAAVVLDGKALLARFRHSERQGEEPHFAAVFDALKDRAMIKSVSKLPERVVLEGAGDCVWDQPRNIFWMGYGQRSDQAAQFTVMREFGVDVATLELVDARFYHMDTALRPLPGGELIYYPNAFNAAGRAEIHRRVPAEKRIELKFEDAKRLAANCVLIGDALLLSSCSNPLRADLKERGYRVVTTPLGSFQRSGGSAFCLTLRLDQRQARVRYLKVKPAA